MRFSLYVQDVRIPLKVSRLNDAYIAAASHSRRVGSGVPVWLFDAERNKMIAEFDGGNLLKNPKKSIDPDRYWFDKGFNDACLGIRKRNQMKAYLRGYREGSHYCDVREKYGHPTERKKTMNPGSYPSYKIPTPHSIGAVSVGSMKQRGHLLAQFNNQLRAERAAKQLHDEGFVIVGPYKSSTTKYWLVEFSIPTINNPKKLTPRAFGPGDKQAYRGYLITQTLTGDINISIDGVHISWAKDLASAKRIVDSLIDPSVKWENPKFRLGQRRVYPVKGKVAARYKGSLPSRQTTFTSKRKALAASNPRGVKIYGKLLRIEAQKTQKHLCDAGCKKANHRYFHDFTSGPSIYGMPDGSLVIR